ncbi:MAG: translation initiation factor IF-2 [Erysipelotrichaceae bacterium]|nr:translation initiation factor IF-2 [Erysipelotrichaceae bacterium]
MAKKNTNRKNNNNRNRRPDNENYQPHTSEAVKDCTYQDGITVKELASKINKSPAEIIKFLFMMGKMVTINAVLDDDLIQLIAMQYNINITKEEPQEEFSLQDEEEDNPEDLELRAPVVTIMGHVDHGKTTLLDNIRRSHVTESEFGGITQHIGAYQVDVKGQKVTFLDTPGHEAFTAMRARGAKMTDIVVIVVAADDGVMPQTKEAIDHSRAAGVPMIVAVNKIDKHNANIDKVYSELADYDLMPEEWGGSTMFAKMSAKQGIGIDNLLEMILLQAEMMELKANPHKNATGTVVEAKLDKGRGAVATLLVQNGTLHTGDMVVCGSCVGRIRKMTDDKGMEITSAKPSTPVEIIGLDNVPEAGDLFKVFTSEKRARKIAAERAQAKIEAERRTNVGTIDDLADAIKEGSLQEINIIIKADVNGSAEAVRSSMEKLQVGDVRTNVIRATAGAISESDIMLASASNAIIYGFNVRPTAVVKKLAEESGVSIRLHNIIYKALEELEMMMKGMLAPVYEEVVIGQATVKQLFKVSKVGTIAGCMVDDGVIKRDCKIRLIREGVVVYTGNLGSLQRFKDNVKEVSAGYECGLTIEKYNDIKEGDVIEAFEDQEVKEN